MTILGRHQKSVFWFPDSVGEPEALPAVRRQSLYAVTIEADPWIERNSHLDVPGFRRGRETYVEYGLLHVGEMQSQKTLTKLHRSHHADNDHCHRERIKCRYPKRGCWLVRP